MDILFINTTEEKGIRNETNGTLLLATKLLQAGFIVDILRFYQIESYLKDYNTFINDITDKIIALNPKSVSFYTSWPYYHFLLRIAKEIKIRNSKIIIIFGGPQSSATAYDTMKAMDYIDYICTGEGESTVVDFFNTILRNNSVGIHNIPGLFYRKNNVIKFNHTDIPICDLNSLPHWDDNLYLSNYKELDSNITADNYFMPIDAGRGCPYSCTFCCTSYFWRRNYRLKSPERIVDDIEYFNKKFGITSFWFSHDAFTSNKQLVSDVCDYLIEKKLKITWRCTARIDCISEELILKMKQAGMTQIELGIESGSKRMQKMINKNLNLERAREMIEFLIKNNIYTNLFFMYGFPEETEEDLAETLEMYFDVLDKGVNGTSMSFCRFTPMTDMTNKYINELVLNDNIRILYRGIYGYQEEYKMIKDNKKIFTFFYHLNTDLRNKYQYLFLFNTIYQKFPNSMKYLRALYKGDDLKFYRDFYNNNRGAFEQEMLHIGRFMRENALQFFYNTIKDFDEPYIEKIKEILRYDYNLQKASLSREDIEIKDTYNFSYIEFSMKLPIEEYSNMKTEILLEKKNGKFNLKILSINVN